MLDVANYTYNPSTDKTEDERSGVQDKPGLHNRIVQTKVEQGREKEKGKEREKRRKRKIVTEYLSNIILLISPYNTSSPGSFSPTIK